MGIISALQRHDPSDPAIISCADDTIVHYDQLQACVDHNRQILSGPSGQNLAVLWCGNTFGSLSAYLGCLAAQVPVCLVEPSRRAFDGLVNSYRPSLVIVPRDITPPDDYEPAGFLADGHHQVLMHADRCPYRPAPHLKLSLLLTTSGSTGSSKLVRLSQGNLDSNAASIVEYLGIGPGERSIQGLPMHYAYGLSLINSHLLAGATVVLTSHSFMSQEFWRDFDRSECTSFAGVPYMYELLHRLRFNPAARPTLRTLTQAGGSLREPLVARYHQTARRDGKRMFIMYGQTEATARIAYVPPERLEEKIGSIGVAVPGGAMDLEPLDASSGMDQLVYRGPNVMLGYATGPEDLALGDTQQGFLRTGDLARMDEDGFFYMLGRLKRIAKVFGRRINLADIEQEIQNQFPCRAAAIERGNRIWLLIEGHGDVNPTRVRAHVAKFLSLMPLALSVEPIDQLPMTSSGKIDYASLGAVAVG